jgi:hypothetical protein
MAHGCCGCLDCCVCVLLRYKPQEVCTLMWTLAQLRHHPQVGRGQWAGMDAS